MKQFHIDGDDLSDGSHTFGELYAHRCALFVRLCLVMKDAATWRHDPNTPGWIILYLELPGDGQISYHIQERFVERLKRAGISEQADYPWDGHTSHEVLDRLESV